MQKMQKQIHRMFWEWRGVLLMAPGVTLLIVFIRLIGLLQAWEWAAFDLYLRLRPPEPVDTRIAIVGVTETDIQVLRQAIIPDQVYADVITKLSAMAPRAIGLDIYRYPPAEPGSAALKRVFKQTDNLIGIEKAIGAAATDVVVAHPALTAVGRVGVNDLIIDADNTIRRGLLSIDTPTGETLPSFAFYLALLYLDAEGISPEFTANSLDWRLGQAEFKPLEAHDGGYVRADASGYQLLINYRGPSKTFEIVSLSDILNDRLPADWARDRIIIIGGVGESFQDAHYVPYSSTLVSFPERMAGVEVHANITSQILAAAMEGRSLLQSWPETLELLWIMGWGFLGATFAWEFRNLTQRGRIVLQVAGLIGTGSLLVVTTYAAFLGGWWIPFIPPMLAYLGSGVAVMGYIAHTANDIRRTFGRYLSTEIVANLLEDPEGLKLGGERRRITILTSDLRGFTATSERLPPEEVIKVLNFYLGKMADVITRYNGTIDEFMGDGILVLFGAPIARGDEAQRSIACAIDMQLAIRDVNQTMLAWGLPGLEMGIGINTGEVVVGNIGSEKRSKYGIVGSQVNLTYRIESYTVGGQILISSATLEEAGDSVIVRSTKEVQPKGVMQPITIYEVGGIGSPYDISLPMEAEHFVTLRHPLALKYVPLSGKHMDNTQFTGRITQLSEKEALVWMNGPSSAADLDPLTNLKLNLQLLAAMEGAPTGYSDESPHEFTEDVYAKVLEKQAGPDQFYIRFTAKPPQVDRQLRELYQQSQS